MRCATFVLHRLNINTLSDAQGDGVICGMLSIDGVPNSDASVILLCEKTTIVAHKCPDAGGVYRFENINRSFRYTVIAFDSLKNYNAVVADNITPEKMQ